MSRDAPQITWVHLFQPERSQTVELEEDRETEKEDEEGADEDVQKEVQHNQRMREELHR